LFHQYNSAAPFKTITAQNNYSLLARNFHNFNGRGFRFGHFRKFLATFPMIFWVWLYLTVQATPFNHKMGGAG